MRRRIPALIAALLASTLLAPAVAAAPTGEAGPSLEPVRVVVEVDEGASLDGPGIEVLDEFATSDYVVAEVAPDAIERLEAAPQVADVLVDQRAGRALDASVPLVNAPARWGEGFEGDGSVVVVVDDGVAPGHPNLAGKIVAEACFTNGGCVGGADASTSPGSGTNCPGCTHGTHVAGIAAGVGGGRDGVARGADLFSIRVFADGGDAFFSDITLALEHVLGRADDFDIAAVNLSLQGVTPFSATCDAEFPPLTDAVHALVDAGIPVVAASGNRSFADAMTIPACISGVVSVGSHDDGLSIASTSNASASTSLVAPGVNIDSPAPPATYSPISGTSFAAPHVAGAFAIWLERFPGINAEQALFLSSEHGRTIVDGRNGRRYPRLFLDDPAAVLVAELFAPSTEAVGGTYEPHVGDFDGDGTDDLFWYAAGSNPDYVWLSTDRSGFTSRLEPVQGTYRVAVLDQNGDGRDDLFFHGPGGAVDSLWFGRSDGRFTKTNLTLNGEHLPFVGEFTGDGVDDIVLYTPGGGADRLLRGGPSVTFGPLNVIGAYDPLVGDFDGDGVDDVFWYAAGSNPDYVWYGGGGPSFGFTSIARSVLGTYETIVGDFGGDGTDDIFWYRPGPASDFVWRGSGRGPFTSTPTSVSGSYAPLAADVDGAIGDEILWYRTGSDFLWTASGSSFTSQAVAAGDGGRVLAGWFDPLGGTDVFFYRPGPGQEQVWYSIAD